MDTVWVSWALAVAMSFTQMMREGFPGARPCVWQRPCKVYYFSSTDESEESPGRACPQEGHHRRFRNMFSWAIALGYRGEPRLPFTFRCGEGASWGTVEKASLPEAAPHPDTDCPVPG